MQEYQKYKSMLLITASMSNTSLKARAALSFPHHGLTQNIQLETKLRNHIIKR